MVPVMQTQQPEDEPIAKIHPVKLIRSWLTRIIRFLFWLLSLESIIFVLRIYSDVLIDALTATTI